MNASPDQRILNHDSGEWHDHLDNVGPATPIRKLFCRGRDLPDPMRSIAIVGTRRPTVAGLEMAHEFGKALAEAGLAIISGLALGIDAAAHRGALDAGGHTVAVLGCGLDVPYLEKNLPLRRQIGARGTLVSEYPDGTQPNSWHFPARNRIIVGLADRVLIVEGGMRSGALITARIALDAGRTCFAIPGSPRNAVAIGPNELIRRNEASLVTSPEHLFEELATQTLWTKPYERGDTISLSDPEKRVLHALDAVPASPAKVGRATSMPPGETTLNLAKLELRGLARRDRIGCYEITEAGLRVSLESV
jgi:DNA processing protein